MNGASTRMSIDKYFSLSEISPRFVSFVCIGKPFPTAWDFAHEEYLQLREPAMATEMYEAGLGCLKSHVALTRLCVMRWGISCLFLNLLFP